MREEFRAGLAYLEAQTTLLQRVRNAHPTKGLYEAAEMHWWWTIRRSTDTFNQLFWFDDEDQVAASVVVNDFGTGSSILYHEPIIVVSVLPNATPDWTTHVVERGLAHLAEHGIDTVELEVDRADEVQQRVLRDNGFTVAGDALIECWLDASTRPEISPLHDGYRLLSRSETAALPHHMVAPHRPGFAQRLQEISLYRPDLDLAVVDDQDTVAGYGMFWFDPVTATGTVEPMRTHDEHQQRGLARHVLTSGVDRLANAGAKRISIGFEPNNPASGPLYQSVGFQPHRQTDMYSNSKG